MQINYIILAHQNPQQLERLIDRLNGNDICFYIHLDAKSDMKHFEYLQRQNVIFVEQRIDVIWGDFSIVRATLNSMIYITDNHKNGEGYTILLSAQDYPIKTNKEIQEYLLENKEYDFIDIKKIEEVWNNYRERVVARKFNFSSQRGNFVVIFPILKVKNLRELCLSLKNIIKLFIRNPKKGFCFLVYRRNKVPVKQHYAGSAWWVFRNQTMLKILELIKKDEKRYTNYYKECLLPDEIFFQTLLMNIPNYNSSNIKDSVTYVNWTRQGCELPVTFDENDIEELIQQPKNKLFARKFNSSKILDSIDRRLFRR
ncbi:beta-1,6-N-acetylglucosaminyltransferase [Capnocytophaga canis]|uniref:Peptide O-xylosyltransferase n=1 Tax=Capnocytophaga canis TaxID=1848903 RepID=A0A0B7IQG6_9FLAO|nr:beta-1,6-N-acetylglucosaminyltransferase [Capnocytophaga canis]CEN52834.1 Core-2/I-Branching enzyme [Capnocytophaga canis]